MTGITYSNSVSSSLLTGSPSAPRPRIRVEDGSTGFYEAKEFRTYYEYSILTGTTAVVKFVSPVDFILQNQTISVDGGSLRYSAVLGGTEGGTFAPLPMFGTNRLADAPSYTRQVVVSAGGTHTGGTESEVIRIASPSNGQSVQTVGQTMASFRALPAGTYYLKIQNLGNGTITGVLTLKWQEYIAPYHI